MLAKIIAKKKDGTMLKGRTGNFAPYRNSFHLYPEETPDSSVELLVDDLKALFFVKSLEGRKAPHNRPPEKQRLETPTIERRLQVTFNDNECIKGYSHGFHLDRLGFFMIPADPNDNNERIFVVLSSIRNVVVDDKPIDVSTGVMPEKQCESCGKKLELSWKFCPFDGVKIKQ